MSIYDYKIKDRNGNEISTSDFKDKILIIVNTATGCGFTPQYEGLEKLYKKYHDKGLEIIDFPCNQFGGQAPGSDEEIHDFCTLKYTSIKRIKPIATSNIFLFFPLVFFCSLVPCSSCFSFIVTVSSLYAVSILNAAIYATRDERMIKGKRTMPQDK